MLMGHYKRTVTLLAEITLRKSIQVRRGNFFSQTLVENVRHPGASQPRRLSVPDASEFQIFCGIFRSRCCCNCFVRMIDTAALFQLWRQF